MKLSNALSNQEIMEKLPDQISAGGAGGLSTFDALVQTDANWAKYRGMKSGMGPFA